MVLSSDGERLFVADRGGRILGLEVDSGAVLGSISTPYRSIGGLAVSPTSGALYFVDMEANEVVMVDAARFNDGECTYESHLHGDFKSALQLAQNEVESNCGEGTFSLVRDYGCQVEGTIPNGTLFDQVRLSCVYIKNTAVLQCLHATVSLGLIYSSLSFVSLQHRFILMVTHLITPISNQLLVLTNLPLSLPTEPTANLIPN